MAANNCDADSTNQLHQKTVSSLYHPCRKLYQDAHPQFSRQFNEKNFIKWWQANKHDKDLIIAQMTSCKLKVQAKGNALLSLLSKTPKQSTARETGNESEPLVAVEPVPLPMPPDVTEEFTSTNTRRDSPAQSKTKKEQDLVQKELLALLTAKNAGLILSLDQAKRLKELKTKSETLSKKLKRLKTSQHSSQKLRDKKRRALKTLQETHPELSQEINEMLPNMSGRPRLERDQPGLLDSIIDVISSNSSADEKRRSETLRTVKTLDQLLGELRLLGYNISRSGLYIRLLPRNCATLEGKRHVKTVPVKLVRAQNSHRKSHPDTHFAAATIKFLKNIAELYGPKVVSVISQDDKAKIPLGLPAAKKQAPILMKMDYRVQLPDHDFVVASGHKLIPSVYAGLEIKDRKVTYSGPTFIALRSGKHDSSTAPRHAEDLHRMMDLPEFEEFLKMKSVNERVPLLSEPVPSPSSEKIKPIMILLVDGGPDESPRYQKTLKYAAINFRRWNLDALFIGTHAPGQSASNPVERRMAPLSRDLCGLILPHDSFGSHLNNSGKTVDKELEVQNFQKAGELLAELWSEKIIDKFPVIAEYVQPKTNIRGKKQQRPIENQDFEQDDLGDGADSTEFSGYLGTSIEEESVEFLTEVWKKNHVRQSQYLLQFVKCEDSNCCGFVRTNIRNFFRNQFLPCPVPVLQSEDGLKIGTVENQECHFLDLSTRIAISSFLDRELQCFDKFCPSVQSRINDPTYRCTICGEYFVTKIMQKLHKSVHLTTAIPEDENEVQEEMVTEEIVEDDGIFFIEDIGEWLTSPFSDEQPERVP